MHELLLQTRDGERSSLLYDERAHALFRNGERLAPDPAFLPPASDENRRVLRVSLGKRCNFRCAYCLQGLSGADRAAADAPDPAALDRLVEALAAEHETRPFTDTQFWGGEPLVYFETIRRLHAGLSAAFGPDAGFGFCTNGSLLFGERMRWILDNHIHVTVSWDGDGQPLRGEDPLLSPRTRDNVRRLVELGRCAIAPVLTRASGDVVHIGARAEQLLGLDRVPVADIAFLIIHDETSGRAAMPESSLRAHAAAMHRYCLARGGAMPGSVFSRAAGFLRSLNVRPARVGETACFVGKAGTMTVDTRGNILTCQNFEADTVGERGETYRLGNIIEGGERRRPDLAALEKRQKTRCATCAVRQICRGGCPYWPDGYEDYNCRAAFAQALAILGVAVFWLTGGVLTEVVRTH